MTATRRRYEPGRVDLRGAGDSDGILEDEYLPREQQDALEVIAWLAQQPWCDGSEIVERMTLRRGGWRIGISARRRLAATAAHIILDAWLTAHEGGQEVFGREWQERIERDLL